MIENLRKIKSIKLNYDLGKKTWFGTGGKSTLFFIADSVDILKMIIRVTKRIIPILIIGSGSNILVRDGGFKGIVIKLGKNFKQIELDKKKSTVSVGSGVKDSEFSKFCLQEGICGFEFLSGIPGTIGGNLKMNAGCYGGNISDNLIECKILNDDLNNFKNNFNSLVTHSLSLYGKSFYLSKSLEQQIINFAALTNFVAIKGGLLKKEQMLSGDMADIFSNLYLAISVKYYDRNSKASSILTEYVINRLLNENQIKINKVIDNLGYERYLLQHLKKNVKNISYEDERKVFDEVMSNNHLI